MAEIQKKPRILFLPKWYPDRNDPMAGLFIQRQAEALTPFCDVAVISLHPEKECPNLMEAEFSTENEVRVLRIYYKSDPPESMVGKVQGMWRFYRTAMKAVRSIRAFQPDLVHTHVLTRMGLVGWKTASMFKVPLVISEHWSRYYPANGGYRGPLRKMLTWFVVRKAHCLTAVSDPLKEAMLRCGLNNRNFWVVPNVIDQGLFSPASRPESGPVRTIMHVSCFEDYSKDISGFLDCIKALSGSRQDFRCLMVGDGPDRAALMEYVKMIEIPEDLVQFPGLKTGEELAGMFASADFSVLSSRYETFGTVIAESLSCGIPVVSTTVGIAPEIINETNGMLVSPGDKQSMISALDRMLDHCRSYDRNVIAAGIAGKFSNATVGKQLYDIYRELIGE